MKERFTPVDGGKQRDDGLVEQLLGLADPGPEIPADGARQIKNAIRPAWERGVRTRLWLRRSVVGLGVAAGLVLAFVALRGLGPWGGTELPLRVAVIEVFVGAGQISSADSKQPRSVHIGDEMTAGSSLRTLADGGAALRLAGGESLRLGESTTVQFDSSSELTLEEGALYVDSPEGSSGRVEIKTALGFVREIGTQFEVRMDPNGLVVRVREGSVKITTEAAGIDLAAGSGISLSVDGELSEATISPNDPIWDWVVNLAPPVDLEGATAEAFLNWVSSETGLAIEYSGLEVEDAAQRTTLHGSLIGLGPGEAVEVVLPSCGLGARKTGDRLVIHQALQ